MSTESGIPDFSSAGGLYTTQHDLPFPAEYMLSHSCLVEHPAEFFDFYRTYLVHPQARPNAGHRALAALERAGQVSTIITQNIDGLHQEAGSRQVIELHGSVHRNRCLACGRAHPLSVIMDAPGVPRCSCGGWCVPRSVFMRNPCGARISTTPLPRSVLPICLSLEALRSTFTRPQPC
nr:Sir2 family NAD-dependent protein deacetylase [Cutibacterium acnes]